VVKAGAIKPPKTLLLPTLSTPTPATPETLATLHDKSMKIMQGACNEAGTFLAPWPVRSCAVSFSDGVPPVTLHLSIGRDHPLSEQEARWLTLAVEKKLGEEVPLKMTTVPFLPALIIGADGLPDAAGKKALEIIRELTRKNIPLRLTVNYPSGTGRTHATNLKKARRLKGYLQKELEMAGERIYLKASGSSYLVTVQEEEGR
jgi:hypothetical protein